MDDRKKTAPRGGFWRVELINGCRLLFCLFCFVFVVFCCVLMCFDVLCCVCFVVFVLCFVLFDLFGMHCWCGCLLRAASCLSLSLRRTELPMVFCTDDGDDGDDVGPSIPTAASPPYPPAPTSF